MVPGVKLALLLQATTGQQSGLECLGSVAGRGALLKSILLCSPAKPLIRLIVPAKRQPLGCLN
jgi:hypothetical protein